MLLKNVASQGVFLFEYTAATGAAKTGDSANITGYWSLDGGTATVFGTAHPTELSAADMPGVYWQPLAQGETNGNAIAYSWTSTTSGVVANPLVVLTTGVSIPVAAPGAAGGSFIAGTNAATVVTTSLTTHFVGTVDTVTNVTNTATAGDFTATQKTSLNSATPTASLNLAQTLSAFGSALTSSTADTALTVNEALHCAIASVGGQQTTSGTAYTTKTSTGTTIRAFTLDQNPNPNNRS